MSALPYHKRYHGDALTGFMALTLEERGAYQTLLDMMYDRGGPIADNERLLAGYMNCSIRKWRQIRDELIAKRKIRINRDGHLTNERAEKEIENQSKTHRKLIEAGAKGGRTRVENEKKPNENREGSQASLEPGLSDPQAIPEARSQKLEEKSGEVFSSIDKLALHSGKFAFSGATIRLTAADLERWRTQYHGLADIEAELTTIDAWWDSKPAGQRSRWFHATAAMLNRKHQEVKAGEKQAKAAPLWDGMP